MKPRAKRGLAIVCGLAALGIASALVLNAFQSNLVFFFSPSQIAANEAPRGHAFRVGGPLARMTNSRPPAPDRASQPEGLVATARRRRQVHRARGQANKGSQ